MITHRQIHRRAALAFAAVCLAGPARAGGGPWTSSQNAFGTVVSNGHQSFFAPDEKAGRQMARALNKAERKADRAEGNGGGSQPAPGNGGSQDGEQGDGGDDESGD